MAVRTSPLRLFLLYFLFFVDLRPTERGEIKGGEGGLLSFRLRPVKEKGELHQQSLGGRQQETRSLD